MDTDDIMQADDADAPDLDDYGDSMDTIYRGLSPWEQRHFPAVEPSAEHAVLINLPLPTDSSQPPRPFRAPAKWDALHVRLPCSPRNQYPVSNLDGTESIKNRWQLICDTLCDRRIRSSHDLEAAILSYNTKYARTWRFRALHQLCADMSPEARVRLFEHTVPGIVRLALQLPDLCQAPIPLLKCGTNGAVTFSQQQIATLLANAFLCTFPRRNTQRRGSEYRTFPDINFNRLFQTPGPAVAEKLKCFLYYFKRVAEQTPLGTVTVARRGAGIRAPEWSECGATFEAVRMHVASAGTIEDQGNGLLQVDFANKYLGGGVLGRGCVQEEIRFVICPELMVTKLVVEVLQPSEAVFVAGVQRFAAYEGYAGSFAFAGRFVDETPVDEWRRRCCTIVAIDALNFRQPDDQYGEELMRRELTKAYAGYKPWLRTPAPAVATGNWGCGAFGGEKRLKALLQLMVCAVVARPLVYYTFGDVELRLEMLAMWRWLRAEKVTIAQLWSHLKSFQQQHLPGSKLFPYLYQAHRDANRRTPPTIVQPTSQASFCISSDNATMDSETTEPSLQKTSPTFKFTWPSEQKTNRQASPSENDDHNAMCDSARTTIDTPSPSSASITTTSTSTSSMSLLALLDADYSKNIKSPRASATMNEPVVVQPDDAIAEAEICAATKCFGDISDECFDDDNDGDSKEDDIIPATPTRPGAVTERAPLESLAAHHKRQASMFEYLKTAPTEHRTDNNNTSDKQL